MEMTYPQFQPLVEKMGEVVKAIRALQLDDSLPTETLLDMRHVERGLRLQETRLRQLRDEGRIPGRGYVVEK